jgi:hypothetical protein
MNNNNNETAVETPVAPLKPGRKPGFKHVLTLSVATLLGDENRRFFNILRRVKITEEQRVALTPDQVAAKFAALTPAQMMDATLLASLPFEVVKTGCTIEELCDKAGPEGVVNIPRKDVRDFYNMLADQTVQFLADNDEGEK